MRVDRFQKDISQWGWVRSSRSMVTEHVYCWHDSGTRWCTLGLAVSWLPIHRPLKTYEHYILLVKSDIHTLEFRIASIIWTRKFCFTVPYSLTFPNFERFNNKDKCLLNLAVTVSIYFQTCWTVIWLPPTSANVMLKISLERALLTSMYCYKKTERRDEVQPVAR